MLKDINSKETFTLKVKRDIISNISRNDGFDYILMLILHNGAIQNDNYISIKCTKDEYDFYKNNFDEINFIKYRLTKKKYELKISTTDFYNKLNANDNSKNINKNIFIYFNHKNKFREFIKYSFILNGTILDPNDFYHLEIKLFYRYSHDEFIRRCRKFDLSFKSFKRNDYDFVYLKEADQIADFLRVVESYSYLLEFENLRIFKEVRNDINRKQNCEIANLNKVISTSVKQQNSINYINDTVGLGYLSDELREIAEIRLETENLTLQEIGELTNPKTSKSTVNYRLKKIISISEDLRRQKNVKSRPKN